MTGSKWLAGLLAVVLLAGAAACGGDDDDAADTATQQAETPTVTETSVETATASPGSTPEDTEDPSATATRSTGSSSTPSSLGTPEPPPGSGFAAAFLELDSFRYAIDIEVNAENPEEIFGQSDGTAGSDSALFSAGRMTINGAIVGDDLDVTLEFPGTATVRTIQFGGEQFTQVNGGTWLGPQTPEATGLKPDDLFSGGFFAPQDLEGLEYVEETVNGVATRRYQITRNEFSALEDLIGASGETEIDDASVEVWLAEDGGFPVRMEIFASGVDQAAGNFTMTLTFEVTDINAAISIERPT